MDDMCHQFIPLYKTKLQNPEYGRCHLALMSFGANDVRASHLGSSEWAAEPRY